MSSLVRPRFDFERDVDIDQLKRSLSVLGYKSEEIHGLDLLDLKDTFERTVIEAISLQASSGYQIGISQCTRYGFKSIAAVGSFITQPEVLERLGEQFRTQNPLSNDLMTRMQRTFTMANAEIRTTDILDRLTGSAVLATLPYIFDLIKSLSDKEVDDIQLRYGRALSSYLAGSTLKEFRNDLTTLPFDDFETKYAGCFAGMLENVVGHILDHEQLLQIVKEEAPLAIIEKNMEDYKNAVRSVREEDNEDASILVNKFTNK